MITTEDHILLECTKELGQIIACRLRRTLLPSLLYIKVPGI